MSINDVNADAHSEVVEDLPATAMNFLDGAGKLSDFRFCMSQQPKPSWHLPFTAVVIIHYPPQLPGPNSTAANQCPPLP